MDKLTPEQRSRCMRRVRSKNTKAELTVRKTLFSLGFHYRLNAVELPGKPDIVFRQKKQAIFVNGCFWHQHRGCKRATRPATNRIFWENKLSRNIIRDRAAIRALKKAGWDTLVIWECETKRYEYLEKKILSFMQSKP
jgi:DNA mismatch endonuclease, patch repair protein